MLDGFYRARTIGADITLIGLQHQDAPSPVSLLLHSSGVYHDYNDQRQQLPFVSTPVLFESVYTIDEHDDIVDRSKPAPVDYGNDLTFEPTPYSTWTLEIPSDHSLNAGLNFHAIQDVEMMFYCNAFPLEDIFDEHQHPLLRPLLEVPTLPHIHSNDIAVV